MVLIGASVFESHIATGLLDAKPCPDFGSTAMLARREFLKTSAALSTIIGGAAALAADANTIVIDPKPLFDISPLLYMQFMEPLGTTDASVEAAWNYDTDDWRQDFIDTVAD